MDLGGCNQLCIVRWKRNQYRAMDEQNSKSLPNGALQPAMNASTQISKRPSTVPASDTGKKRRKVEHGKRQPGLADSWSEMSG